MVSIAVLYEKVTVDLSNRDKEKFNRIHDFFGGRIFII